MKSLKIVNLNSKSYKNIRELKTFLREFSSRQGIYESNVLQSDRHLSENSDEIINLSNDSKSMSIPKSHSHEIPKFFYENDTIGVSLNERGTINLSSNMHANLPQPPNEAVKLQERPYNAIVSLGEGYAKNDKIISEQQINNQNSDNLTNTLSDDRKLALYLSNEKRFGIKFSSNCAELVSQGLMNVDSALDYQKRIMTEINSAWIRSHQLDNWKLQLFLPFSADDDAQIDNDLFLELYEILEIDGGHHDIEKLKSGAISCSSLIDKVDQAVRKIVREFFDSHQL